MRGEFTRANGKWSASAGGGQADTRGDGDQQACQSGNDDALFAVADVYASAHYSENVGLAIAQAMAHGKPVVATAFGGCQDFLDATCGYPVPAVLRAAQHGLCAKADSAVLAASLRQAAGKIMTGDLSVGIAARERIRVRNSPRAVAQSVQLAALTLLEVR